VGGVGTVEQGKQRALGAIPTRFVPPKVEIVVPIPTLTTIAPLNYDKLLSKKVPFIAIDKIDIFVGDI
jgi:hypothetical protein